MFITWLVFHQFWWVHWKRSVAIMTSSPVFHGFHETDIKISPSTSLLFVKPSAHSIILRFFFSYVILTVTVKSSANYLYYFVRRVLSRIYQTKLNWYLIRRANITETRRYATKSQCKAFPTICENRLVPRFQNVELAKWASISHANVLTHI